MREGIREKKRKEKKRKGKERKGKERKEIKIKEKERNEKRKYTNFIRIPVKITSIKRASSKREVTNPPFFAFS